MIALSIAASLLSLQEAPVFAQTAASTAPSGSPSAASVIPFSLGPAGFQNKVIFVIAEGADAPTRGRFVSEIARQLQTYYIIPSGVQLVSEPTWTITDYMNACANFADQTAGSLIVEVESVTNGAGNWFLRNANWTELSGMLLYSSCRADKSKGPGGSGASTVESTPNALTPVSQKDIVWKAGFQRIKVSNFTAPKPKPTPTPYSMIWATNIYDETGQVTVGDPLPVAGVLLSLVSAATALFPSRTTSGVDTIVYPTPFPWLPGPSNGYVSQRQTTNQTVANPQNETALATGFLSSSITYGQNLSTYSTNDDASMKAVRKVVAGFLQEIACPTPPPSPTHPQFTPPPSGVPPAQIHTLYVFTAKGAPSTKCSQMTASIP